ncbi:hypothetical protein CANARDRAFT_25976 [[Candida] arabinofermentans NRRL YB-2248]|uniref:FAS1 domain-containing protein n=1 Tax=[Candida] arabinofermentans NRRL YB-2248 TaxID=983967 RepID=A0A1E4T7M3_9ASCO|nr:hypothetical protein CANARDRAFT_25976 [[Candida] arabinofermentans NRRL YB-2248]
MKFGARLIYIALLLMAFVEAKNVFKGLSNNFDELELQKRDGKRIANIDLKAESYGVFDKRDAKNVVLLNLVVDDDFSLEKRSKRDAKNIFNLQLNIDESELEKRDAKKVASLNLKIDDNFGLYKRDASAKNVQTINLKIDESEMSGWKAKRDNENVHTFHFVIPDTSLFEIEKNHESILFNIELDQDQLLVPEDSNEQYIFLTRVDPHAPHKVKVQDHASSKQQAEGQEIHDDSASLNMMPDTMHGSLATALTQFEEISIFASYIRDMVDLYKKCETHEFSTESEDGPLLFIFAPSNEAIVTLNQKPWEFPTKVKEKLNQNDEITTANIKTFIESHVVEGQGIFGESPLKLKTLNGNIIYLKNDDGQFMLKLEDIDEWLPIETIKILNNGALLIIDKTLTWPGRD